MNETMRVSKDETILFDKVKKIIDNNPGLKARGYHAIYEKCAESNLFTNEELRTLGRAFKGGLSEQLIHKITTYINNLLKI